MNLLFYIVFFLEILKINEIIKIIINLKNYNFLINSSVYNVEKKEAKKLTKEVRSMWPKFVYNNSNSLRKRNNDNVINKFKISKQFIYFIYDD